LFVSNRDGNYEIYAMNADGSDQINLTHNPAQDYEPSCYPNGSQVLFLSFRDNTWGLFVMNIDGTGQRRVYTASQPFDCYNASWTPNGSKIVFNSRRDGDAEIFVMNADGSDTVRITDNNCDDVEPACSPDNSSVVFVSYRNFKWDIFAVNIDGTGERRLTDNDLDEATPSWSPDGKKIVFAASWLGGDSHIYTMNADGTNLSSNVDKSGGSNNFSPVWVCGGRRITFVSILDMNHELYVMDEDGENPRRLTYNDCDDVSPTWLNLGD